MATSQVTAEQILDTALQLAEGQSWAALRLHDIAGKLDITLDQIHSLYSQKDDIAEALLDRADRTMLAAANTADFLEQPLKERLQYLIMAWLGALAPHRHITGEILQYKMLLLHVHLQLHGLTRISRTMQWLCEAAVLESLDRSTQRELEEIGITAIYLRTFQYWLSDDSADSENTQQLLSRLLNRAEKLGELIFGPHDNITGGHNTASELSKTHRHANTGDEATSH
ncbi:MAG: TetR/AcrR family transcriptional regulator [Gammaproteobacteria bacterium]|nr:TetR/AcrR family transcriptional regulator [Gammaproteobacteria bacterium]